MTENIKPGYMLQITSYVGDAYYYNTETHVGLPLEEVQWIVTFLKEIQELNDTECTSFDLYLISSKISQQLNYVPKTVINLGVDDYFEITDHYLGGCSEHADYQQFRTLDSYKVYYIPVECVDVTEHF